MSRLDASTQAQTTRVRTASGDRLRIDLQEASGALADLGTFLPLSVALSLTCGVDFGLILIFAGLMNVLAGVRFRQPIPVQPMKAIAAVAIASGLSAGEIASAGVWMGLGVLGLAVSGGMERIARAIPRPVVRGIQVGIGLKLLSESAGWLRDLPAVGWDSWLAAGLVGALLAWSFWRRRPLILYVFGLGLVVAWVAGSEVNVGLAIGLPSFPLVQPTAGEWWSGLTRGAVPQLPLTLLNSVVAVCALSGDYFPGRGIGPRRMAVQIGLMNLLSAPLGGMPMCHGAGGLAAQYRFGARTGGSVVLLGTAMVVLGLFVGSSLGLLLVDYPRSILTVMVLCAGVSLAAPARDCLRGASLAILAATALVFVAVSPVVGVAVGVLATATARAVQAGRLVSDGVRPVPSIRHSTSVA